MPGRIRFETEKSMGDSVATPCTESIKIYQRQ